MVDSYACYVLWVSEEEEIRTAWGLQALHSPWVSVGNVRGRVMGNSLWMKKQPLWLKPRGVAWGQTGSWPGSGQELVGVYGQVWRLWFRGLYKPPLTSTWWDVVFNEQLWFSEESSWNHFTKTHRRCCFPPLLLWMEEIKSLIFLKVTLYFDSPL